MTFRFLQLEGNINSAAMNNLGYVFWWKYSLICRLAKLLLS